MTTANTTALDRPNVDADMQRTNTLDARATALQVKDPETMAEATILLGMVNELEAAVETRRVALVKPLNDHVKYINGEFKTIIDPLSRIDELLRGKILAFRRRTQEAIDATRRKADEDKRNAEEERRRAEAEHAKAAADRARADLDAEFAATPLEGQLALSLAKVAGATAIEAAQRAGAADARVVAATSTLALAQPPPRVVSAGDHTVAARKRWTFEIIDAAQVPRDFLAINEKAIRIAVRTGAREIPGVRIFEAEELAVG